MSTTETIRIVMDERGVPYVAGTTTKVVEVVLDHLAYGRDADEIQGVGQRLAVHVINRRSKQKQTANPPFPVGAARAQLFA